MVLHHLFHLHGNLSPLQAKRKLTTGADSLPPTPAPTPSTGESGDDEGGGVQMSWTIKFPPSSSDDIGYRLGVRNGTADDPDSKVFVAEVSLSGGSHPEMRVGDEVLEINKMRPIDGTDGRYRPVSTPPSHRHLHPPPPSLSLSLSVCVRPAVHRSFHHGLTRCVRIHGPLSQVCGC